jgi:hypothetical protein
LYLISSIAIAHFGFTAETAGEANGCINKHYQYEHLRSSRCREAA